MKALPSKFRLKTLLGRIHNLPKGLRLGVSGVILLGILSWISYNGLHQKSFSQKEKQGILQLVNRIDRNFNFEVVDSVFPYDKRKWQKEKGALYLRINSDKTVPGLPFPEDVDRVIDSLKAHVPDNVEIIQNVVKDNRGFFVSGIKFKKPMPVLRKLFNSRPKKNSVPKKSGEKISAVNSSNHGFAPKQNPILSFRRRFPMHRLK